MPGLTTRPIQATVGGRARLDVRALATALVAASPVVAAVLYTLATPPFTLAAAAWLVPGVLLAGVERLSLPRAFVHGALFGALIACGITWWALDAAAVYFGGGRLASVTFVAAVWLVFSALPYGLLALAFRLVVARVPEWSVAWCAAWLWVACEWLRTALLTGLPWGFLAHTQWRHATLLQVADLGGMYAVSFVVAVVGVAAVRAGLAAITPDAEVPAPRAALRTLLPPAVLLGAVLLYGALRLPALAAEGATHSIAVVQVDTPARLHWQRAAALRTLAAYSAATREAPPASLVVWPESAVAFYPDQDSLLRAQLAEVARDRGAPLLFGGSRLDGDGGARNAVFLLDGSGEIRGTYDKQRLLPFAEYDPLGASTAPERRAPVYRSGATTPPLDTGSLRLGVLVCYEALFPALARARVHDGADVLVNLSNDSWLDAGDGAARAQHFAMTVFRAVETRRPLVRAAAGGISGVVDASGTVRDVLSAGAGLLRATIVPGVAMTAYVRFGDAWIALGGLLLGALLLTRRGRSC